MQILQPDLRYTILNGLILLKKCSYVTARKFYEFTASSAEDFCGTVSSHGKAWSENAILALKMYIRNIL